MKIRVDITGHTYGRLTVVGVDTSRTGRGTFWTCRCECGGTTSVLLGNLRQGRVISCGCAKRGLWSRNVHPNIEDLTGQRFGRLVAQERVNGRWRCLCDCGKEISVSAKHLKGEQTRSCKCLQAESNAKFGASRTGVPSPTRLAHGESAFNSLIKSYKYGARTRSLEWRLSNDEARALFAEDCHYCGVEPLQEHTTTSGFGSFVYNGIDRKNNSEGYVKTNVVTCCRTCNYRKGATPYSEFLAWVHAIHSNLQLGMESST